MSQFFLSYFGSDDTNQNGEISVNCPFEHDKGYEVNPSAHVNIDRGLFHCKTCEAEGRMTGFSEEGFIAHLYGISYADAIRYMTSLTGPETEEDWIEPIQTLQENEELLNWLANRGISKETAYEYKLGYNGNGIDYPVFVNGVLCDVRTYNIHYKTDDTPKIRSRRGATPLLFPFDEWQQSTGPTLICAGENDTLLARQMGFNAITSTMGEGNFPKIFIPYFKNKEVYVCYDCDEAGRKSARKVAFQLFEAGSSVRIVDLGLAGTKEDKDLTDFFIKHSHSAQDLNKLMQQAYSFTGELYQETKDAIYPLVNLWDYMESRYENKYISSRVMMMGKFENSHGAYLQIPSAVQFNCDKVMLDDEGKVHETCQKCPIHGGEYWWSINQDNMGFVINLTETDDEHINEKIAGNANVPYKSCPGKFTRSTRDRAYIQRVLFSPDVDTEDELRGYRGAEIQAYVINPRLEDGQRYRVFYKRFSHPKNRAMVMVVDRVEQSDNAINAFKMTPQLVEQLSQFQGSPNEVMKKRLEMAKLVVAPSVPKQVQEAVDILYHSVLDFRIANDVIKGHPEGAIIGESRTGKSQTAKKLMQFYGIGNHTELKNASVAGLIGGAESLKSGFRIKWGEIPRNNGGLLILDEAGGVTKEQLAHLTGVRSERKAVIKKIVSGTAPAYTRLLWIANPRTQNDGTSRPIAMYSTGVDVILDLFGSDEDIARLDFAIVLPTNDTYIAPFRDERDLEKLDNTAYRNLIRWAWSRTVDQIKFAPGVEQYIWQTSQELNELYDTRIKLFGPEAFQKLARISVSIAAMCFSHDGTGDVVVVSKDHVDFARGFLTRCYDNPVFRLRDYVAQQRLISETTEEANNEFEKLVRTQPLLIKTLNDNSEISTFQLQTLTGLERQAFSDVLARMLQTGLISATTNSISATLRFKKSRDAYLAVQDSTRMVPLSQQHGSLL